MTKTIVACVDDLFFRSKIEATARHLNVPITFVKPSELPGASAGAAAVLMELSSNGDAVAAVEQLRGGKSKNDVPVIGFLSHVDKDLAQRSSVFLTLVDGPHSGIRIGDDGRERLIQFMGE